MSAASWRAFQRAVSEFVDMGAEAVVLGCTEIGLLLRPAEVSVPLFDTTELHARAAAMFALGARAGA